MSDDERMSSARWAALTSSGVEENSRGVTGRDDRDTSFSLSTRLLKFSRATCSFHGAWNSAARDQRRENRIKTMRVYVYTCGRWGPESHQFAIRLERARSTRACASSART